jgi:hypothetical protein
VAVIAITLGDAVGSRFSDQIPELRAKVEWQQ